MNRSATFTFTLLTLLIANCSDTEFASQDSKNGGNAQSKGSLQASFVFSAGEKTMKLTAQFKPKGINPAKGSSYHQDYELIAGSTKSETSGGFPEDLAKKISLSPISAAVDKTNSTTSPYTVVFNFENLKVSLTQSSTSPDWSKVEQDASQFGVIAGAPKESVPSSCKIEANGSQPKSGVYAVVLTKPAECDFKLPSVKVGSTMNRTLTAIPIGSYWQFAESMTKAHSFSLLANAPKDDAGKKVHIDNGFILVQPDNTSYLLVDAGVARVGTGSKTAQSIASEISQSLGYGTTTLKQPSAGSASDNYATATLFKKGSVIAIYDDTPDMAGRLDVSALVESAALGSGGLSLKWTASEAKSQ